MVNGARTSCALADSVPAVPRLATEAWTTLTLSVCHPCRPSHFRQNGNTLAQAHIADRLPLDDIGAVSAASGVAMRVAIVGAGFYGCYIARAIERRWPRDAEIEMFDREAAPMMRAATNNQSRLHLGFHYPRSRDTIRQTIQGWSDFTSEFGACLHFPAHNLYAVHRDGLLGGQEYLSVMDEFDLQYEDCTQGSRRYFRDNERIEVIVRVGEAVVDLEALDGAILAELKASIACSSLVTEIDSSAGTLVVNGKMCGPYDFIVNATYVSPNLGLPESKRFALKYELAGMLVLAAPFGDDIGLTVMDGGFASLYPCGRGRATLSSVIHTPFFQCDTVEELEAALQRAPDIARTAGIADRLVSHGEELFAIDDGKIRRRGLRIAPKVKLQADDDATRISAVRDSDCLVSVLCGKLDAVHATASAVISAMDRRGT